MDANAQPQNHRDNVLSSLNAAIEAMNLAGGISSVTPAKAVFGTVSVILTMIRDSMINQVDYVELGLACADICTTLDRGLYGKDLDDLNSSVREALGQLTTTVAGIQRKIIKKGERNAISRLFHAKNDKEAIATWRLDLVRILHVFNTELAINTHAVVSDTRHDVANTHAIVVNTHTLVSDVHRNMLKSQEGNDGQHRSTQNSTPGESPPPPPRAFFGRNELIEKIVDLTENLTPIALIGAGGIGKTSIALTVLHDSRVKERFGDDRRFIRCEQFPSSLAHFLHRLSKVIGAGIENPQDLTALRPFLSSKEMLIVLDNAESILDPQGTDSQEIYVAVEELSQFGNVCLFITSRISTIPPDCKRLDIPTLSMDAAYHTFYRIYDSDEQSNLVNKILEQLDFHPLSITLLATVAHHNKWDAGRLTKEWERRRTNMLQTEHNKSLAATIELSLASPMFQELGSDARGLLGVVAFFPQGVDENNIDWLFPSISNGTNVFNKFCILSLTYRSNGFITMLAPLRDYLRPKDPKSSPLLCATKEFYFTRLSVDVHPRNPGSEEARWIKLEDANVEHLLDVFTTIDANSDNIWDTCADFMHHLYWHKPRLVALGPKIKGLPDDHHSKPRCLFELSNLFEMVGNEEERKQLLIHTLRLWRERGNDYQVAQTLAYLSDANRLLGHYKLGIQQAKEALEIYEQLNDAGGRALCLKDLAGLLHQDGQLDAAEETAFRARASLSDRGDQFQVCRCHRILGEVYQSKGETEKAIHHFKTALEIASPSNWHGHLFWIHWSLAELFSDQGGFDDAHTHVGHAKSHAVDDVYHLARATVLQARLLCRQGKLEKAKSEVLHAADVYKRLGAARDVEIARELLQQIEGPMENA